MKKILMVYIEPTPYIIPLIIALNKISDNKIDVLFLYENLSQNWNLTVDQTWLILPKSFKSKITLIRQLFFKNHYDAIHLAGWSNPVILLFLFLSKLTGKKIIVESDTPLNSMTRLWKKIIKKVFYPILFCFIHIFLPGGKRQAAYFRHYGVNSKKIVQANMTVDVEKIIRSSHSFHLNDRNTLREHHQIPHHAIVFLFLGRLVKHKGILELLDIFSKIQHPNAVLMIAGDGDLNNEIRHTAKHASNIRYIGRLSGEEVYKAYYASDVFVLPSHVEPWGLVVNEAMAMGLPVIVSDQVGSSDDLVEEGKTGFIFPAGDIDKLKKLIEVLLSNEHLRKSMSTESKVKIADWTLENEAKNICLAWSQVI